LTHAAVYAGIAPSRVSEIERHPAKAKPGEIERLQEGVDRAYAAAMNGVANAE
jgi:hypothetical protein